MNFFMRRLQHKLHTTQDPLEKVSLEGFTLHGWGSMVSEVHGALINTSFCWELIIARSS